eukprot:366301-Chlamydomonas_euryale.AAC.56
MAGAPPGQAVAAEGEPAQRPAWAARRLQQASRWLLHASAASSAHLHAQLPQACPSPRHQGGRV